MAAVGRRCGNVGGVVTVVGRVVNGCWWCGRLLSVW